MKKKIKNIKQNKTHEVRKHCILKIILHSQSRGIAANDKSTQFTHFFDKIVKTVSIFLKWNLRG